MKFIQVLSKVAMTAAFFALGIAMMFAMFEDLSGAITSVAAGCALMLIGYFLDAITWPKNRSLNR